jgi:hypothetical protein
MISKLKEIEGHIPALIKDSALWNGYNLEFGVPRIEQISMKYDENCLLAFHVLHPAEVTLFHKHCWTGAFKILSGSYEMGVSLLEEEVTSYEQALCLPTAAKLILNDGTYYEMTYTHGLHYVKPIGKPVLSLMLLGEAYPEQRSKPPENDLLVPLSETRKLEILSWVNTAISTQREKREY